MSRARLTVTSWEQLQERIGSIIEELNRDPALTLAAAANPLTALDELGYEIQPEARSEIEDRLRFPPEEAAARQGLRSQIFQQAGHPFDVDSADNLRSVLYDELSITPYPDERGCYPDLPDTRPPHRREPVSDPLRVLAGRHPIIEPLLEYRRLDASRPRFAPQAAYEAIRNGTVFPSVGNLRVRLKREPREARGGPEEPPLADRRRRSRRRS